VQYCVADADEELLKEAKELLVKNGVKKIANLEGMDVKHIRFEDAPKATTMAFLKKAIRCYEEQYGSDDEPAPPAKSVLPLAAAQQLESVVVNVLGKAKRSFEQVNPEQLLEKDGMGDLFPAEVWPELNCSARFSNRNEGSKERQVVDLRLLCVLAVDIYIFSVQEGMRTRCLSLS